MTQVQPHEALVEKVANYKHYSTGVIFKAGKASQFTVVCDGRYVEFYIRLLNRASPLWPKEEGK